MVKEIRLLFGRPATNERNEIISALREIGSRHGCTIQALDADFVVSEEHLLFAAEKAMSAFSEGRNVAKDLGVEMLRYASGERQIERALCIGISSSTERMVLIMVAGKGNGSGVSSFPDTSGLSDIIEPDDQGISFNAEAVKEAFHISDEEIRAVGKTRISDLVLERVALVDTYR
jgi:KEOPS complex subunit Cgi121